MPVRACLFASVIAATGVLSACTVPDENVVRDGGVFDPFEEQNREVHEFNRDLDRLLVRPAAKGYGTIFPDELIYMVDSFAGNITMPGTITNAILQLDIETTGIASGRFFINTVFGFAGLIDTATAFGIPNVDADFGQTLHVWGVPEGAYLELPFIGPSTERDAVGWVVDLFTNPLGYIRSGDQTTYSVISQVGEQLGDRDQFSDTVDSILYESADSYAQLRLIYLQNRRFELGQQDATSEIDPFALDTEGF